MILCESGPEGGPALFAGALEHVVADDASAVAPALARLDQLRAQGLWIAGYAAYEAGLALEPRLAGLMPKRRDGPLLAFGAYAVPQDAGAVLAQAAAEAGAVRLAPPHPLISRADYGAAFARVADYIAAGDCYQINLTFPLESRLEAGTPLGLYAALRARQAVGFGAYADLGPGPVVISRSPELFFAIDASGRIEARPMKGTAPRSTDPAVDAHLAEALRNSQKDRAENLMIVDLLRNDIARIAQVGSVRVPALFTIDSFATVHQMSSRVVGQLAGAPGLAGLMAALLPCGSITGAPKIRAMEIIREVEPHPRGVYCGAIGWMAPDGRASFSVAIRTLRLFPDGRVVLNVGGGVVYDSTEAGEWEEALWKARFADLLSRG
ncbi:MAG: aminodeoxychorismate synthase component I [Pseudorhodobacter sp.]|nr:aminodeoxychorismate synthase component I [Pseudorhodobacter sp.]